MPGFFDEVIFKSFSVRAFSALINFPPDKVLKTYVFRNQVTTVHRTLKRARTGFLGLALACMTLPAIAGSMGVEVPATHPWSVTGSLGYTVYEDMYRDDGQTTLGRFAIGRDVYTSSPIALGLEVGVQSGNTMRYFPSQEAIDALGGLPIQTTVKPMLDLLATLKTDTFGVSPIFAQIKGGISYRRWQFNDRNSINDKSQIAGEVQAGLGYFISERANLSLFYQGIFGSTPDFRFSADNATGRVSNIPLQNGGLLGLTVSL
ncbi:TPA: hypothetical protein ACTXXA_001648 [Legionella anisa]